MLERVHRGPGFRRKVYMYVFFLQKRALTGTRYVSGETLVATNPGAENAYLSYVLQAVDTTVGQAVCRTTGIDWLGL